MVEIHQNRKNSGSGESGLTASCDGFTVRTAHGRTATAGQELKFGVRPEHIEKALNGAVRPGLAPLPVVIDLVQPTGSRTYGTFLLGGIEVVAELEVHDVERPGDQVTLHFDMNRVVLIDPESEAVISHSGL